MKNWADTEIAGVISHAIQDWRAISVPSPSF
jgi:hypothetical protein